MLDGAGPGGADSGKARVEGAKILRTWKVGEASSGVTLEVGGGPIISGLLYRARGRYIFRSGRYKSAGETAEEAMSAFVESVRGLARRRGAVRGNA